MENISEAMTLKEEKEMEIKDAKAYKLNVNKDVFELKIAKSRSKTNIIIQISKISELINSFYENAFTFEDLLKLDKTFRACDDLNEIYEIFLTFFNENKAIIKEVKDDSILLGLKILSITGKVKIVDIKLLKKEMNQDSVFKNLCKQVNRLEEENKALKEEIKSIKNELNEIKNIRNELNELKNWKSENEYELSNLIKEKKNKSTLENIGTKILTNAEDFEFLEKAYKKDDKMLLNKNLKPKLIYRATRDGDSSSTFHNKCDNIKGTLTLVKTQKGLVFGGFTDETWNGSGYKKDDNAFCFSIDLKKIYNNKKTGNSIFCDGGCGPIFGDYFFRIYDKSLSKGGMMNDGLNKSYDNQEKENEINNGESNFGVSEVEVFKVLLE